jgi:hypothetical protein
MDTITCSGHGDLIKLPVSLGAAARFLLTITIVVHTDSLFRTTMGAGQRTISASADHRHNPHERVPLTHVRAFLGLLIADLKPAGCGWGFS